ncbi:putative phosphoenolpyruvate synthase, partial [Caerostris darwini]
MKAFDHWRKGYRRLGKLMVSEGRLPDAELLYFFPMEELKDLLETRTPGLLSKKIFPTLEKYVFPEIMKGFPEPPGEILITLSTDIDWSPYFPIVSGVVTEIGGLISH